MASAYAFLDIAVLDDVRGRFAAGDALVVLSLDLAEVLWANGAGAQWLGYADLEAAIGAASGLPAAARRQIASTPGFPDVGCDRPMGIRFPGRLQSRLFNVRASTLALPGGEKALLLALPAPNGAGERAERVVAGFDEPGHFAAFLDEEGRVAAASAGFVGLGIEAQTLTELVEAVRGEEDRLVKRRIRGTRSLAAGIARLTDAPATHLLVVVDEGPAPVRDEPAEAPASEMPAAEPPPAELPMSETRSEPAAPPRTVRFAWRTDAQGRFSAISEEFAEAMGRPAADVIGRSFREVANAFGLDPDGSIARLLERRDTWSGRTVMWPLSGTALKVPVDLAALPIYGRERNFEGFRGFGIARLAEAQSDPEAIGTVLVEGAPQAGREEPPAATEEGPAEVVDDPFLGETPAITVSQAPAEPAADKVVRLAEHRETGLSPAERTAFREIGDRLRRASQAVAARGAEETAEPQEAEDAARPPDLDGAGIEAPTPAETSAPVEAANGGEAPSDDGEAAPEQPAAPALPPDVLPSAFFQEGQEAPRQSADTSLLSQLPLPVLVHSSDRLHYANRELLRLTGYADLAALEAAGGLGALFEEPHAEGGEGGRLRLRTAEGVEVSVEGHLQSVPWEGGKALMLALRPVAERAPAEESEEAKALEKRLMEMRAIVDTATDGIAVIAGDGTIRSINRPAEALFGFDAEHLIGKPFTTLFAIESRRTVEDYLSGLADHGVASVLNDGRQVIGREAQGRFIPLFITIGRLPNGSGYCAVLRDITQWKRAEEELTQARAEAERASSQKSEFLARVSHEIRTPLNAIIGFSELMIDERFGPIGNERYRDYLRDINRSGNHVLDLVNDLLDISKIEAGQQEMQYEAVSLNETLAQVVAMMQPQANGERVIIRSSFASRLPEVVADLRSVRQIALNLMSNAVRYTPAGGQVIVSTAYAPDGSVVMRVRDTGVGMSSAELDEALKPFKQISTLRRKRGDGTGLGLPLTRAMVEANRAQFTIHSTPGDGTLVEITFPPTRVLAD